MPLWLIIGVMGDGMPQDVCHFYSLTQRSTTIRPVAHFKAAIQRPYLA